MTTDPVDLVLDPTCGSGTTAYVAEQWGRRWITIDTSRIALNIAKKRLTTALFPYYKTHDDSETPNIHRGFVYKKVPHITLKALANDLPFDEETLYDQPEEDKKRIRVSGPFSYPNMKPKAWMHLVRAYIGKITGKQGIDDNDIVHLKHA